VPKGVHIALLRGVNVGGKNRLPMKELAAIFTDAGCGDVRTFIQSGNVLFTASQPLAARLPGLIADAIESRFGFHAPVVLRRQAEFEEVVSHNPFLKAGVDTKTLHVGFLMDKPESADLSALDPDRSPPDKYRVRGGEVYMHLPNGMARTKLTSQYFDSRLKTTITARNWATVTKLLELSRALALP
jgi:uncharacterized protein (DUF1697 family)